MDKEQYLLTKLAEECSEVAQIALKAQQFGLDEVKPGQKDSNRERIHAELNDLNAIVLILNEEHGLGYVRDVDRMMEKIDKVEHYREYSVSLGKVE